MVPIALDALTPAEAVAMFVRLAPRAEVDRQAVAGLVRECGYLPLAITIMASLYLRHRSWRLEDLWREVRRSTDALLSITAEHRSVAAVFGLSYQNLPADRQRLFRLLGLHPGIEFEAYAVAALAGIGLAEAAEHLDRLHGDHLLEEPSYRRYRMHDLIRAYAHTLATSSDSPEPRDAAVGRLLDYYQHTAIRADAHLGFPARATAGLAAPAAAPELATWHQAAGWLRTERANLLACIHHTTATGQDARAVRLTAGIAGLLRADGFWSEAIRLHEAAAAAADRLGDQHARATARYDLAAVRRLTGDYPVAAGLFQQALDLYQGLGDRPGQAAALHGLGLLRRLTGAYPAAVDLFEQALSLYRQLGDRRGQAAALYGLGAVRAVTGDYPAAIHQLQEAFDLYRELGDRRGQAHILNDLGPVRAETGDYAAAADLLHQALDAYEALGDRRCQAYALNDLGVVRRSTGDYQAAADLHLRALGLHGSLADRHGEAIASTHLAVVRYLTGDYDGAANLLHKALAVLPELDAPEHEAEARNHLGIVHRLTGDPGQALALHRQALAIARRIHHRLEEARALDGIGRAALEQGGTKTAITYLRDALRIYQQLGVPEAVRLAAELAAVNADPPSTRSGSLTGAPRL
jgi:tetratricopeptide (TPR) repeat protein